jgi:hypothetical protein
MIGDIRIISKEIYLQTNEQGTLIKAPKLRWYYKLYFYIKNQLGYKVYMSELKEKAGDKKH